MSRKQVYSAPPQKIFLIKKSKKYDTHFYIGFRYSIVLEATIYYVANVGT